MSLLEWFEGELKRRGLTITEEDLRRFIRELERREWISIHPELYRELMEESARVFKAEVKKAKEEVERVKSLFKGDLSLIKVESNDDAPSLLAIGSDASRCPIPLLITRVALMSGIALRHPSDNPPSILKEVVSVPPSKMGGSIFRFYVSAKCESLIPITVQHQLLKHGEVSVIVVDGPLSISQWYRGVPGKVKDVVEAVEGLVEARGNLMKLCREMSIPLISVVKRSRSRYFHNYFRLTDESRYSDQYVFHQMLDYGYRTESISITEAIIRWRRKAKVKDLLITKLPFEVYGFYIKTSRSPLTPPVRVEYPAYMKDREDWIASYVLSTAVQTCDPEFDGLPVVQCLAHRDAKIAGRIMWEIYKQRLYEMSKMGEDLRLIAPSKGEFPG